MLGWFQNRDEWVTNYMLNKEHLLQKDYFRWISNFLFENSFPNSTAY